MYVVAGIDFTEQGRQAVQAAAALARRFGDRLLLLHAREPLPHAVAPESMMSTSELDREDVETFEHALEREADLLELRDLAVETRIAVGAPARALVEAGRVHAARLLVVGSHGRGPAERLLLGSVADRLVRTADRPVLVVRSTGARIAAWSRGQGPLSALMGVDFDDTTGGAVEWARTLRSIGPVDLTCVHAFIISEAYARFGMRDAEHPTENDPEVWDAIHRDLKDTVGEMPGSGNLDFLVRSVWGSPARAVAETAGDLEPDLLIVGTHGRRGFSRMWFGSFTEQLMHDTKCSLLFVPRARRAPQRTEPLPAIRSVLAASDLGPLGDRAVRAAAGLLTGTGGLLHVVHVHRPGKQPDGAAEHLRAAVPEHLRAGVALRVHLVAHEEVGPALAHTAERIGPDLVVIGARGRERGLGGVTARVVRGTGADVLLVREAEA